jgi:hypothetical protein
MAFSIGLAINPRTGTPGDPPVVGSDAPGGDLAVQIRVSDQFSHVTTAQWQAALKLLVNRLRERLTDPTSAL